MNDYTAHEIHRLDQAYPDAVNTIDDLTGDPARKTRLAEVGPEVFAAELTRDLANSAATSMSLAAWAAVATVQLMVAGRAWEEDTDLLHANVADRNASLDRVIGERNEAIAQRDLNGDLLDGAARALGIDLEDPDVHYAFTIPTKVAEVVAALAKSREQAATLANEVGSLKAEVEHRRAEVQELREALARPAEAVTR